MSVDSEQLKKRIFMADILKQSKELRKIWGGFQGARVLLTANNYRVFDYLKKQKAAAGLAKDIGADKRATEILLDALTGLGLLKKQKGQYKNSSLASQFLISGSPYYQGDIIRHADTLWQNWSGLDNVVKTGKPHHVSHDHRAFILGMHNLAVLKSSNVLKAVGLKGVKKALDLGGGPGTYTIKMAKKGISVTIFDTPETIEIAKEVISKIPLNPPLPKGGRGGFERNFQKNINFLQGDFLADDFGRDYDLIFISQILHAYSEDNNIMVLKKCRNALNKNGRIVIQEFFIDKDRTHPVQAALFSINMLANTSGGRCYSPEEIKRWYLKTGFRKIQKQLLADSVLISAKK